MTTSRKPPYFPLKSSPSAAFPRVDAQQLIQTCALSWWGYLSQWNLLDYPVIMLPITTVESSIDLPDTSYQPVNEIGRDNREMYDPSLFEDVPVGVQLVGRSMQEEQLLAVAMAMDQAVKT